jgi:hypothetical protein
MITQPRNSTLASPMAARIVPLVSVAAEYL